MRMKIEQWSERWVLRAGRNAPGLWGWLVIIPVAVACVVTAYQSGRVFEIIGATLLCCLVLLDFERRVFYRVIERQQAELTALKWENDALVQRYRAVANGNHEQKRDQSHKVIPPPIPLPPKVNEELTPA